MDLARAIVVVVVLGAGCVTARPADPADMDALILKVKEDHRRRAIRPPPHRHAPSHDGYAYGSRTSAAIYQAFSGGDVGGRAVDPGPSENQVVKCGAPPSPPSGTVVGRCVGGQWEFVAD